MESYTDQSCSFIVKMWVEEKDEESGRMLWRGYITHVLSGKRQYFENIPTAFEFVLPYLEAMGIKIETGNLPRITRCS